MSRSLPALLLTLTLSAPGLTAEPAPPGPPPRPLPGTKPLTLTGDIASTLVDGVDRFLLREIERAAADREKFWKRDATTPGAYEKSVEPNRLRLAHILGVRDPRVSPAAPELVGRPDRPALVGRGGNFSVFAVRWKAFGDVHGEGLLLVPAAGKPAADVVAVPDADVTPEQLCGLTPGLDAGSQFARRLAESGCRVLVPALIPRTYAARNGRAKMTDREFIYRSAFEMGRHLIGYEVQKVLAGVDWFAKEGGPGVKIGVVGHGEGGMLALYAAALDRRVRAVGVAGYVGNRDQIWQHPIDRNVFGLLQQFGDAELLALIAPRGAVVGAVPGPTVTLPSEGGAPARLESPPPAGARAAARLADKLTGGLEGAQPVAVAESWPAFIGGFAAALGVKPAPAEGQAPEALVKDFEVAARQARQLHELDRHNQQLLEESPYVRAKYMSKLDTSSLVRFQATQKQYRDDFAKEVIGQFDHPLLPADPRTRLVEETDSWTRYQVVLDVFPDVIAYGLLTLPRGIKADEKRPVVVCQHGLEGRPEDVIGKAGQEYYKAFATKLAERGFITFAPQNLYIFRDRFRTLQRKANPIQKTLFSVIVPQHRQITGWLKTLPGVDPSRIAFYGLSYGGKSAMRIPPLVDDYCLSICSADFNDWVWKNASSRSPYSYVWTLEYEIFEWDLGSTFNYSEMAALIAPRPFMVERGHFDGVAPDERVALEFAKVRHLYQAKLGLGDRAAIEWFVGPHTINGVGTYEFLHKHLKWPAPK